MKKSVFSGFTFVIVFGGGLAWAHAVCSPSNIAECVNIAVLALVLSLFISSVIRIADFWSKAVVLRLRKFQSLRGTGLFFIVPIIISIPYWIDTRAIMKSFKVEKFDETEEYHPGLTVINKIVVPAFRYMAVDCDGQIRIEPSFPYAMQRLIAMKDNFDISVACDADHGRHGIVTKSTGLLNPNHYLSVAIFRSLQRRPKWKNAAAIGKTVATTELIEAKGTPEQKEKLRNRSASLIKHKELAGESIDSIIIKAQGNNTEDIY